MPILKGPPHDNEKSEYLNFVSVLENPPSLELNLNFLDTYLSRIDNAKNSPLSLEVDLEQLRIKEEFSMCSSSSLFRLSALPIRHMNTYLD